jgi:hypothetical protein
MRAAFFYPWFPQAWNQQGLNPFTHYHPSLGLYDSSAAGTIANQVAAMQYGKIAVGIASWWGQGTTTDGNIPMLLAMTTSSTFRWSLYYEPEGQGDPTVAQIGSDLDYIIAHYGTQPSFQRVNGRPVIFVYGDAADGCAMADRWAQARAGRNVYIVLKVFPGYRTCASQPDGWHQYAPAVATDSQAGYSYAISPGFYKANETTPRLGRDLTAWNQDIQNMVASGAPFQLVTTFNEWGEGTSVESATEWATGSGYGAYLDALHTDGQGSGPGPTPTPTPIPTPTPAPTATPTITPTPTPTPPPAPGTLPTFKHVYTILMENEEASSIIGNASAPYINRLAATYGLATNYTAVSHPSEPNYLALWSGSTQGVTDDGVYNFAGGRTLADQIETAGRTWHVAAQNVPLPCSTAATASGGPDGTGTYARKHEPAISWTSVSGNPTRCANITDFSHFDPNLGNYWFIAPNLCNDMHDCSIATGDAFLAGFIPKILNSAAYADGGVLYLTWDEGSSGTGGGGKVVTIVVSPLAKPAFSSATAHTHYSLVRTVEDAWSMPCLANACSANNLAEFFR